MIIDPCQCEYDGCENMAIALLPTGASVCETHLQEYKESEIDYVEYQIGER